MTREEAQAAVSAIINELMAENNQTDENYVSNLRMFHQLTDDGRTDELKLKLVDSFAEYYCHTMFSENPIDVLTMHHIEFSVKKRCAELENKHKLLN